MIYLKKISIKYCLNEKKKGILSLSPEILEYLLTFCDLKSLLKVRLTHSGLCRGAHLGIAERLHLRWHVCLSKKMTPLQLVYFYPTLYFANLTKPIHFCVNRLPESCLNNLKPDFIESFLMLYPNGDESLPRAVTELNDSIAGVLDDGEVLIWEKKKTGYHAYQLSGEDSISLLHNDSVYKLYAITIRGLTTIVRSHSAMNPKLTDHLKGGVTIKRIYSNDWVILAKLSNEKLIYVTDPSGLSAPPHISSGDKINNVYVLKSNLFLVWLENGRIFVWGKDLDEPIELMIPDSQKIRTITPSSIDFTILLEDARTILQYGYLGGINNGLRMTSFQLRNRSLIKDIYVNDKDYLAVLVNGKISTWRHSLLLGNPPVFPKNYHIRSIYKSALSFCVLLNDGRILNWGAYSRSSEAPPLPAERTVKTVVSTLCGFAALLDNQTVFPWGHQMFGGELPKILVDVPVKAVFSNNFSFMALLKDGRVCCWGGKQFLFYKMIDIPENRSVKYILPCENSFLIQLDTGDVLPVFMINNDPFLDQFDRQKIPLPKDKKLSVIDRDDFNSLKEMSNKRRGDKDVL